MLIRLPPVLCGATEVQLRSVLFHPNPGLLFGCWTTLTYSFLLSPTSYRPSYRHTLSFDFLCQFCHRCLLHLRFVGSPPSDRPPSALPLIESRSGKASIRSSILPLTPRSSTTTTTPPPLYVSATLHLLQNATGVDFFIGYSRLGILGRSLFFRRCRNEQMRSFSLIR